MKNGLDCRGSPASKNSERLELCVESTNYDAEPTLHCRTARKRVKIFVPSAAGAPQRQAPIPVLFQTRLRVDEGVVRFQWLVGGTPAVLHALF